MESHNLAINTRLSCFFCSRSNSRNNLNPQVESDSCGNAEEIVNVSSFHEFSLRNIYRFLNLLHSDKEEKDFNELKMPICEDCFRLNREFNEHYNLLEEMKLRLNWCIQKMHDVMTKTKAVDEDKDKAVKMEEGDHDEKLLKILRANTLDRMKEFARTTSFPRVLLRNKCKRKRQLSWTKSEDSEAIGILRADTIDLGRMMKPSTFTDNRNCKLSCFYCLRSNSRNLQLETDAVGNTDKAISSFHEFSLRNLHRFLNLLHSDQEEKDFSDLKMPICEDCLRLNGEFNKIYKLMEETKLRLNWCIQKLQDVMGKARSGSEIAFHEVDLMEEDVDEEKILEIWRIHTFERMKAVCDTFVSDLISIGKWEKKEDNFVPILGDDTKDTEEMLPPLLQPSFSVAQHHLEDEDLKKICHDDSIHPIPGLSEMQKCSEENDDLKIKMECDTKVEESYRESQERCVLLKEKMKKGRRRAIATTSKKTMCKYCSYVFRAHVHGRKASMMKHQVRFHPEHYLMDQDQGRPEHFRQLLIDFVFPKFVKRSGRHASCSLCGLRYKSRSITQNVASVRQHLIFQHKAEIKHDLEQITGSNHSAQSKNSSKADSDTRKKRAPGPRPGGTETETKNCSRRSGNKKLLNCAYCRFKSISPVDIEAHLVRFHPEHYLIDENDQESILWLRRIRSILKYLVYPEFLLKVGDHDHRSCSLCGFKYNSINSSAEEDQKHLIFNHRTELKEKLKLILEDPSLEERLNCCMGIPLSNQEDAPPPPPAGPRPRPKPRRPCDTEEIIVSDCPYCVFNCGRGAYVNNKSRRSSLEKHFAESHPEHYVCNKNEMYRVSGISPEHYQTILMDVVFPKFTETETMEKKERLSCSLCNQKYWFDGGLERNIVWLRKHLIFQHNAKVKEAFRVIVDDVLFGERLNSMTRTGGEGTQILFNCPYCRFKGNTESSIERHLVRFHPHHFFVDVEEIPEMRHPHFLRILIDVAIPKFVVIIEPIRMHTKCSLCGMKYTIGQGYENNFSVKKHLLLEHKPELIESVKVILEDPKLLQEKRGSSSSVVGGGVTCTCGVYFSHEERTVLNYHKKFHCIHVQSLEKLQEKVRRTGRT